MVSRLIKESGWEKLMIFIKFIKVVLLAVLIVLSKDFPNLFPS